MKRIARFGCVGGVGILAGVSGARSQPCTPHWADDLWGSGPPGHVRAMAEFDDGSGSAMYFGTLGSLSSAAGWISRWDGERFALVWRFTYDPTPWSTGAVSALLSFDDGSGPALYAGGGFQHAPGTPASNVARWTPGGWGPLGAGTNGHVRALAVFDDGAGAALYAGGYFTTAGAVSASCVARWDGGAWSALGSGLAGGNPTSSIPGAPVALALAPFDDGSGTKLYVGGIFQTAGGVTSPCIARWDGQTWSGVGGGVSTPSSGVMVRALTVFDDGTGPGLYIGGDFLAAGVVPAQNVAKWAGGSWHETPYWPAAGWVSSLTVADLGGGSHLYAGSYPASPEPSVVHRLEGGTWVPVGPVPGNYEALAIGAFNDGHGTSLYAGGTFGAIGGVPVDRVARWNGSAWSRLPDRGAQRVPVGLKVVDDGTEPALYAFREFHTIGGVYVRSLGRFDGTSWTSADPAHELNWIVDDVEAYDDGTGLAIYVSGSNVISTGSTAFHVARRTAAGWGPVPGAVSPFLQYGVACMRAFDDASGPRLFVGGAFTGAVAAWDGVSWSIPGGGLGTCSGCGSVGAFEVFDAGSGDQLYTAGALGVHRWTGAAWERPPGPVWGLTRALRVHDQGSGSALYASVQDPQPGIVRFDGVAWTTVGSGLGSPTILAGFDDGTGPGLYAAGMFPTAGVPGIMRWDGTTWTPVGGGIGGPASALAVFALPEPALWVGGDFLSAGALSAGRLARWVGCGVCYPDCNADGALTVQDFGCFQTKFVAGDPHADCNGDGALTVQDFACFQTRFVQGCP